VRRIVVVGASLAGLRAAEALRERGFDGELHVVGDEPHAPYNRPPLSKGLLTGADTAESCALQGAGDLEAEWHLGRRAERLDAGARAVVLDRGERLPFDGLVIATARAPGRGRGPAFRPAW
jgi:3-phenylpropionate/trans-cinnamate dioxygenase ferredoxin reductase component